MPAHASGRGEQDLRENFYSDTEMGSIAWVNEASTRRQARESRRILVLGEQDCYEWPRRNKYWILVNHRNVEHAGRSGYVSVRLIYENPEPGREDFVHIYRNNGWQTLDGHSSRGVDLNSFQTPITASAVVEMHNIRDLSEDERQRRREEVQRTTHNFHARTGRRAPDSWTHAYLLDRSFLGLPEHGEYQMQIMHLRFVAMADTFTRHPLGFSMNHYRARSVRIMIDMPGFGSSARSEVSKRIVFLPNRCPSD